MKFTAFNATCPFEIGDKIKSRRRATPGEAEAFRLDPAAVVEEVHTITDIVCEHSVKLVHIVAAQRHKRREEPEQSRGVKMIFEDESGQLPPEFVNFIWRRFV